MQGNKSKFIKCRKIKWQEVYTAVNVIRFDIKVLFMSGYTANIMHKKGIQNEGVNFIAR